MCIILNRKAQTIVVFLILFKGVDLLVKTKSVSQTEVTVLKSCELESWEIIVLLIVAPPMGIYFMFKYKSKWSVHLKMILSLFTLTFVIFIAFAGYRVYNSQIPKENIQVNFKNNKQTALPFAENFDSKNIVKLIKNTENDSTPTNDINVADKNIKNNNTKSGLKLKNHAIKNQSLNNKPSEKSDCKTNKESDIIKNDNLTKSNNSNTNQVYITPKGKCYHLKKCGKGDYMTVTLEEAESRGLKPCKRCYKCT